MCVRLTKIKRILLRISNTNLSHTALPGQTLHVRIQPQNACVKQTERKRSPTVGHQRFYAHVPRQRRLAHHPDKVNRLQLLKSTPIHERSVSVQPDQLSYYTAQRHNPDFLILINGPLDCCHYNSESQILHTLPRTYGEAKRANHPSPLESTPSIAWNG